MVVAHLRGLLWKNHRHGARSIVSESVILEALSSEIIAGNIAASVDAELAMIPVMNERGVIATSERSSARLARASELRLMDIYKVADQVAGKLKLANAKNELSLYQVYQIAEKSGIFDAFDEHYKEEDAKPLL